jgi:hypothetical protein
MKTISMRQPWLWATLATNLASPKRIENREDKSSARQQMKRYRGPLLLHASAGCTRGECVEALEWMIGQGLISYRDWPGLKSVPRGGVCGRARVVGLITPDGDPYDFEAREAIARYKPDMRWHARGQWGHILADVEPLPFVPVKGMLGLFDVPMGP